MKDQVQKLGIKECGAKNLVAKDVWMSGEGGRLQDVGVERSENVGIHSYPTLDIGGVGVCAFLASPAL